MPGELDGIATQSRSLREWFRVFIMQHKGRPLARADLKALKPLNRLLARDEAFKSITAHDGDDGVHFELRSNRH
jgi:hypothetical protein